MRLTYCVLLCAIEIYYQQCFGLNFIDLPGFGSNEKSEESLLSEKTEKDSISSASLLQFGTGMSSEESNSDSDSDKKVQKMDQILGSKRSYDPDPSEILNLSSLFDRSTDKNESKPIQITEARLQTEPRRAYPPVRSTTLDPRTNYRRHWLVSAPTPLAESTLNPPNEDKDENIKSKISMLVEQTMHDTEIRMKTVQKLKDKHRDEAPYRVGFILSMIKKSRDVLNELFNVAVKHRDEWKALEQLKIFELIVHTNVDTTNLVRQLVEIHIQNLNMTNNPVSPGGSNSPISEASNVSSSTTLEVNPPPAYKKRRVVVL